MTPFAFKPGDPLRKAAESFIARLRRGERPTLAEYTERFPDHAMRIREVFPRLLAAERRVNDSEATGPFGPVEEMRQAPKNIGDYLIVREIGRGGMGIVYEAVQASLGRQVALKVLPSGPYSRGTFLERFRREARAAARLHHTNIVPVYGVGEADGVHYYAMQYIEGMGLDAALKEFRHRRGLSPRESTGSTKTVNIKKNRKTGGPLLIEDFELGPSSILPSADAVDGSPEGLPRPGQALIELAEATGPKFYRSIARLGVQAAEAVAYAHLQGVLHRDIKPSNFLLDRHGILWITDFGLAKAEGEDMTGTGDIVGTLRYMAPERFDGISDARSDVYALGMTLYEMIALRPAFDEEDRVKLVKRIARERPTRLSQIDPNVPRDLETIILKAIDRDPSHRYTTAAEMADDLRRYLTDRPITARRASTWEELRRWCRRNQLVTGLIGLIALLWTLLIAVVIYTNIQLRNERDEVFKQIKRTESEQRLSEDRLWNSQVTLAQLRRASRKPGQRFDALDALEEARRLRPEPVLAMHAIASLALPDVRRRHAWDGWPIGSVGLDFDSSFERYVRADRQGVLTLRSVVGDLESMRLPAIGGPVLPRFSRNDGYLGIWHERDGQWRVWRIQSDPPQFVVHESSNVVCFDFGANDLYCASGRVDGLINIWQLPDGKLMNQIDVGGAASSLAFHPFRSELAVALGNEVVFFDVITGQEKHRSPALGQIQQVVWNTDGRHFAVATIEGQIQLYDQPGQASYVTLPGHRGGSARLAYHPNASVLASTGPDDMLRLWDAITGRPMLSAPARMPLIRFSRDGGRIAADIDGHRLAIFEVETGREYRTFARRNGPAQNVFRDGSVSPDGQWLAVAANDGVTLWNFASGEEMAHLNVGESTGCLFVSNHELLTSCGKGAYVWTLQPSQDQRRWEIGPPRQIATGAIDNLARNRDGSVIAAAAKSLGAMILNPSRPTIRSTLLSHEGASFVSVHPDGTDLATGTREGSMVRIWDARTNRLVREIAIQAGSDVVYSPDGRWLAVNPESGGVQLYDATRYQPGPMLPAVKQSRIAFSPDGKLVAVGSGQGSLRVYETRGDKCELIAELEDPSRDRASWLSFTPNGSQIIAANNDSQSIHVWDLAAIRRELSARGLAFSLPDFVRPTFGPSVEFVSVVGESLLEPVAQARWSIVANTLRLSAQPADADAYCRRGTAWHDLGLNDLALDDYTRALNLQPAHAEALYLRGMERFRRRNWESALADFVRVQEAKDGAALGDLARWMRGKVLLQLDRVEDMMKEVNGLLTHYPNDPQLFYQRALGHSYRGHYEAAVSDLHLALKHGPTNDPALNNLAWIMVTGPADLRDLERGLKYAQRAVALAPQKGTYQNTLGVALYRLGRFQDAFGAFQKSLEAGKGQFDGYDLFFQAMCLAHLDQLPKARECLNRAQIWQSKTRLNLHESKELERFRQEAQEAIAHGIGANLGPQPQ